MSMTCSTSTTDRVSKLKSLVPAVDDPSGNGGLTAVILFRTQDPLYTQPRLLVDSISIDEDFYGLTPLNQPDGSIVADVIAVPGLAGHAYGSWAQPQMEMWLQDYLAKDVPNVRILTYGYDTRLRGNEAGNILLNLSQDFIHRLLDMRISADCESRPIIFVGHSLGCLIIKKALVEINGFSHSGYNLPVPSIIFFGAPHRGLETTALETIVKSQPSEELVRELKTQSPTIRELNDKFRHVASNISILTCYETVPTKTANRLADGQLRREGKPELMVKDFSARLDLHNERPLACNADHSRIAKLKRSEASKYYAVRSAVLKAVRSVTEPLPSIIEPVKPAEQLKILLEPSSQSKPSIESKVQSAPPTELAVRLATPSQSAMQSEMCTAVQRGDIDAVRKLLAQGCSVHSLVEDDSDIDQDPFLLAARWRQERILKLFFKHNANPSRCTSSRGFTALHFIAYKPKACQYLVNNSLIGLLLYYDVPLETPDKDGGTPFIASVKMGEMNLATYLLNHGANVQATLSDSFTALHFAAKIGHPALVELLIDRGAQVDARATESLLTPLHCSARLTKSSGQCAKLLLKAGADKNAVNSGGFQALQLAAWGGTDNVVTELIAFGVDVNARNTVQGDLRALHYAKYSGYPQTVELLLEKGADPFATGPNGVTPLRCGWHEGSENIAAPSEEEKKRCRLLLEEAERAWKLR